MSMPKGFKHSVESRQKMSISHKGKKLSKQHRQNISLGSKKYSVIGNKKCPVKRFWDSIQKSTNPNDCWKWQKCKNHHGYGVISVYGKSFLAHRFSYILHFGKIPNGLFVLHKCDYPQCCNPNHLFLGTQKDNIQDCVNKKRIQHPIGEKNGHAKLNKHQVIQIRKLYATGLYYRNTLAKKYNVSYTTISFIITRRTWAHI